MPILTADYSPPLLHRLRHVNTMYPYLMRKAVDLPLQRERFTTADDDFIDIDWLRADRSELVILCHGLEGSAQSQYMVHTADLLYRSGFDVLAMNYRSCSGELNKQPTMYHSGYTADLHELITTFGGSYESVHLVGFSLGGNMVLKYTSDGVLPLAGNIASVIAISAPIHLASSSREITRWYNYAYEVNFLKTLQKKMYAKHRQHPDVIKIEDIEKVNSLITFDEYFTGPLHGFSGAEDYYSKCSSLQFLANVHIPTLLIQAQDDPFLSPLCLPFDLAAEHEHLHFKAPKFGGHLGFTTFGQSNYWNEVEILKFIRR